VHILRPALGPFLQTAEAQARKCRRNVGTATLPNNWRALNWFASWLISDADNANQDFASSINTLIKFIVASTLLRQSPKI
jgi:hypothetical protein